MQMKNPTPNFVIIGAQKSGTTSLYEYLRAHPDVFMSSPLKEPGYFLGPDVVPQFWKRRGIDVASPDELLERHMLQGYRGQPLFGEASTYYTIGRRSRREHIPQHMAAADRRMKLIYIVRDPLERIRSNYLHSVRRGTSTGSIADFLNSGEGRIALLTSQYHFQIEAYRASFPAEQLLVLIFEEFVAAPEAGMRQVFEFLGLGRAATSMAFAAHNVSENRSDLAADQRLRADEKQWEELRALLLPDVEKLLAYLGRDIPAWGITHDARQGRGSV
ncbi:MAG: sulfotransferase [Pseudomonadota bacterium]|nr:sulfotransferase [Pseudomonadota bacterium]